MQQEEFRSHFKKALFWDVNLNTLDFDAKWSWVIERIFERGDVPEIRICRQYYGDEKIRLALTKAKWLRKETVYLACAILGNELTDYRCYIIAQSNPEHWLY